MIGSPGDEEIIPQDTEFQSFDERRRSIPPREGRRTVATGRTRASDRNPWKAVSHMIPPRSGRREFRGSMWIELTTNRISASGFVRRSALNSPRD